ncbi:MAG: hypothetical protein AAF752_15105 [Bacteroidota bacterium]
MPERRYTEGEIAEILRRAVDAHEAQKQADHAEGLTLEELQRAGAAAGLPAEVIAAAAAAFDRAPSPPKITAQAGIPMTVQHEATLPGPLTDDAWSRLVADARRTFKATGKVEQMGSLRRWKNGNLNMLVEPDGETHRIRFQTTSSNGQSGMIGSLVLLVTALILGLSFALSGDLVEPSVQFMLGAMAIGGIGMYAFTQRRQTRWSEERDEQMHALAERAAEYVAQTEIGLPAIKPAETEPVRPAHAVFDEWVNDEDAPERQPTRSKRTR